MPTVIKVKKDREFYHVKTREDARNFAEEKKAASSIESLRKIERFLPPNVYELLYRAYCELSFERGERIEEIRIRRGMRVYVTVGGGGAKHNVALDCSVSSEEISDIFGKMCDGSLYAYGESIIKGYISLGSGIRVGVCGHAAVESGRIIGVYDIAALNIRLPDKSIKGDERLLSAIRKSVETGEGVLIYSPPAQGKTSLLRYLAYALSGGENPIRVSLVDTREELFCDIEEDSLALDVLRGYPQAEGIRIATAFMNPQVIICDEIGSQEDALAIAQAQNCGVPLIASTHGSDIESILKRSGIAKLHEMGAFGAYVGIRIGKSHDFEYRISGREGARCENIGNDDNITGRPWNISSSRSR